MQQMMDMLKDELTQIYETLNVPQMTGQALDYYTHDRQRYIEIYKKGVPSYLHRAGDGGIIGKCIPIAQKVTTASKGKGRLLDTYAIAQLLVTEQEIKLVRCEYSVEQDPKRSRVFSVTEHVYTEITAAEIDPSYRILPPEQIRPVAAPWEQDLFTEISRVFEKLGNYANPNIPYRKAELAMQEISCARRKKISLDGKQAIGKLVQLAGFSSLSTEQHQDHSHNYGSNLVVFVTKDHYRLLLQTVHIYNYFRRVVVDENVPNGCYFEPTGEKQEIVYTATTLETIPENLLPRFY